MLSRFTKINRFGGYTWQIKLDSLHHIHINGTESAAYVVEFKEFKWISYKIHFSFVSNNSLEKTIEDSFDKVFDFLQGYKDYSWTINQKENSLATVLRLLENSKNR